MDPSGPSQPTLNQAYTTSGNPADRSDAERIAASRNAESNAESRTVDQRKAGDTSNDDADPTPSSLGYGVRGAPAGEESAGLTNEDVGRHRELEGEQMRAPGEGEVAAAVDRKAGASGEQEDLASDLDRKKAEQAPMRAAAKEQRRQEVDVGGALSERGGPANPVGKNGYPNSGD